MPEGNHMEFDLTAVSTEMVERITKGRVVGKVHERDQTQFPALDPSGSQNYGPMEKACQIVHGFKVQRNLQAFDEAYDMACETHHAGISGGWMGSEQESRVYANEHYLPWLIAWIFGKSPKALRWLKVFHAMAEMSATPEGRCLWVGQRGGMPGRHEPQWIDGFLDVANGRSIDRWRKGAGWGWPDGWVLLKEYEAQVQAIHQEIPSGVAAFDWLAVNNPFTFRVRRNWLHTPDGTIVASWCESTVNGNTPPMMAAVRQPNGSLDWLPRNGGNKRERQKGDRATCVLSDSGDRLLYEATVNRPSPDSLPVPTGMVMRTAELDGSFRVHGGSATPPKPPIAPPVPPVSVPGGSEAVRLVLDLRRRPSGAWEAVVVSQEPIR